MTKDKNRGNKEAKKPKKAKTIVAAKPGDLFSKGIQPGGAAGLGAKKKP
ncbi:MAG: hypothetical protein PHX82_03945 [Paracoccaceae bacterium]|jgi:hypothetical protein|nr:hypothetical protein [Paracoccaceae bacterium]